MSETEVLNKFLAGLSGLPDDIRRIKESFLTNVVMVSEIPAPTFHEEQRIEFLCNRFNETTGLLEISKDEKGNATALLPGENGERSILVAANADTVFGRDIDHTTSVKAGSINGVGLSDNSLAIGALITIPDLLEKLGIRLKSNLILTAATQTLGKADMAGFNFFLDNFKTPIDAALCLRGSEIGRASYSSLGLLRGEIRIAFAEGQGWHRQNFPGAIVDMESILHRILSIPVPQTPRTSILLGSITAGATFNTAPSRAKLRFEARSEDADVVHRIERQIDMVVQEVGAGTTASVEIDKIGRREPSSLPFSHPIVRVAQDVINGLGLKMRIRPSAGLISSILPRNIPGLTLGLTERESSDEERETMKIEPVFKGLAQVITLLKAIDDGLCYEQD